MWGAAKVKHFNRGALAEMLGLAPEDVRLVEVNVGGGFGARGELYPEDVVLAFEYRRLRLLDARFVHGLVGPLTVSLQTRHGPETPRA